MPLIIKLVHPYIRSHPHICDEDFLQAGRIAFLRALRDHDPAKGTANTLFGFYVRHECHQVIKGYAEVHITEAMRDNGAAAIVNSLDEPVEDDTPETHRDRLVCDAPSPEENAATSEATNHVRAAIKSLSPKQRRAVIGRFYEERTFEDIGAEMMNGRGGAMNLLKNAITALRPVLSRHV